MVLVIHYLNSLTFCWRWGQILSRFLNLLDFTWQNQEFLSQTRDCEKHRIFFKILLKIMKLKKVCKVKHCKSHQNIKKNICILPLKIRLNHNQIGTLRFSQKLNKQFFFASFVCLVFGRIYGAPVCFRFYLTFSKAKVT